MASRHDEGASAKSLQKQVSRSDTQSQQKPTHDDEDSSVHQWRNALEYWNAKEKILTENYGSYSMAKLPTKKRISRYYTINDNRTLLLILQGDITKTCVDAIVNAANEHMTGGSGVDGMIHRAAGNALYDACVAHKYVRPGVRLPTGHSRILLSYKMSRTTHYIINTSGPIYHRREADECAKKLSSCYRTALALANLYDLESIGFTAISCGIFGYPADDGADVALRTIDKHADSLPLVVFVLWDDHIYDAWVKKAEELGLIPFDPESFAPKESAKLATDEQSTAEEHQPSSPLTYNPTLRDSSTPNETAKTSTDDDVEPLLKSLPSVPDESSDSQKTEILDPDESSMDVDPNLHPQKTVEMATVESVDKRTTVDASKPEHGNEKTSSATMENDATHDGAPSKPSPNQDEHQPLADTDAPPTHV